MPNQTHRAPPRYKIPGFFSILLEHDESPNHLSGNPTYRELREESSGTVTIDSIPFTKNSAIIYKQEKAFRKFTSFC
jgi:hypothetical protein